MVGRAADEWRELQVLMRELHELDAAPASLHLVAACWHLRRPDRVLTPSAPRSVQGFEPRGAVGASRGGDIEIYQR